MITAALAAAFLFACAPEQKEDPVEAPAVEYSEQQDVLDIKLGQSLSFGASVTSKGPYECAWYVNDEVVSTINNVTYVFNEKGSFTVRFEISNEKGSDSREYTVNVTGEALVVEYSIADGTPVNLVLGDELAISVTVASGDKSTVHSWSIDGEAVAGTADFNHTFEVPGTYTVTYFGINADEESAGASWSVKVADLPIAAEFTPADSEFSIFEKESVELKVKVSAGIFGLTHKWEVVSADGRETVSETENFSYTFTTPGNYTIVYTANNTDGGSFEKSWPVEVNKIPVLPLAITFSNNEDSFEVEDGKIYRLTATVTAGADGLVQEWKVDGSVAGNGNKLDLVLNGAGTVHTVAYHASNSAGDSVDKNWSVSVVEASSLMYDDMEDAALGVINFYDGNKVANVNVMKIVENPHKTAANPSDKVLLDEGSLITWTSSAYFKFPTWQNQYGTEFTSAVRSHYTKMRVKVYVGSTGFTPLLQEDTKSSRSTPVEINGQTFNSASPTLDEWNKLIKTDDWNVFVFDLTKAPFNTEVDSFAKVNQVQFRVAVDFKNNGKTPADVYFDDIEFVK